MIIALKIIGWALSGFAALGLIGYYLPTPNSLLVSIAAFAPYLMGLAVPALIASGLARQRIAAGLSAAIVVFLIVTTAPLYVADDAPRGGVGVRVFTLNARLGRATPQAVLDAVRQSRPDFFMVEELTPTLLDALDEAGLAQLLPFRATDPASGGDGTGLWSRYPIRVLPSLGLSLRSVVVEAELPGQGVSATVAALHVAGPFPTATTWAKDYDVLAGRLAALPSDAPVIVAGDFNATHSIRAFRGLLDGGYADAGDQAGTGLARTYPAGSALLGIDHVLTRGAVGTDVSTVSVAGTDHRGLLAVVALPRR